MKIVFSNNDSCDIVLLQNPISPVYRQVYKHLQHVPIPFRNWDNPFYVNDSTHEQLVDNLIFFGNKISVQVDRDACLFQDQDHLNALHRIYERNYKNNSDWLDFHEHIHLCERKYNERRPHILTIDYRDKSGFLEKKFNFDWFSNSTTQLKAGDVFVRWQELGKTPYQYWKHKEPNDMQRMCELIKPWVLLKPCILVALEDIDRLKNTEAAEFNCWWEQYSDKWCQHWGIPEWTLDNMFSVLTFGRVSNVDNIINNLKNKIIPTRVVL